MFPDWLPVRGLDALLSAGRSVLPVPTTPAGVLEAAVRLAADRMRGQVVTVRAVGRDVPMTVVDLAVSGGTLALAQGRVGEVRFAARDVAWPDLPLERLDVECRDVRFAGPLSTRVVVGAVRVRASVSAPVVVAAVAAADPRLTARFDGDQVWVRRRPWPGELRVTPEVDDGRLRLRPVAVRLGRLGFPGRSGIQGRSGIPGRLGILGRSGMAVSPAPVEVDLELPKGLRLTGVAVTGAGIDVAAAAVDWRDRLSGTPVAELVSLLGTAASTLTVGPRLAGRS